MKIISISDYVEFVPEPFLDGPIEEYKPIDNLPTIEIVVTYEDGSQEIYITDKLQIVVVEKQKFYCTIIHGNIYVYFPRYRIDKSSIWKIIKSWIKVTFFQKSICYIYKDVKLKCCGITFNAEKLKENK